LIKLFEVTLAKILPEGNTHCKYDMHHVIKSNNWLKYVSTRDISVRPQQLIFACVCTCKWTRHWTLQSVPLHNWSASNGDLAL